MRRSPLRSRALLPVIVAGLALAAGYALRAWGEGAPKTQPLFYRGTLLSPDGTPATGTHQVTVNLFETEAAVTPVCTVDRTVDVTGTRGQFRVPLSGGTGVTGDCVQAVHAQPDLWVRAVIDGNVTNAPRTKLGAAPYALEADHAVSAKTAQTLDPASPTNGAIKTLTDRVTALEAAIQSKTAATVAVDAPGPLPVMGRFDSDGGPVLIILSGSAFSHVVGHRLEANVQLDGQVVGSLRVYTNEAQSHKAFPTRVLRLASLAAGAHTLALVAVAETFTDANDQFSVTVIELVR